eukprot:403354467
MESTINTPHHPQDETPTPNGNGDATPSFTNTGTPSGQEKITIDIQELETLRDIINYKAKVLRLQEKSFKTKAKEHQAVKRALIDFIITIFGYLNLEEAQNLIAKICKEYNFKLDEMIVQAISKSNDVIDKELQRKAKFKEHQIMRQNSLRSQSSQHPVYQQNNQFIVNDSSPKQLGNFFQRMNTGVSENRDKMDKLPSQNNEQSIVDKYRNEVKELRKSYATRSLIQKLNKMQKDIQELVSSLNFDTPSKNKKNDLMRYSINKLDCSMRLSLSQKNQSLNNSVIKLNDTKTKTQEKVLSLREALDQILKQELGYKDNQETYKLNYLNNKDLLDFNQELDQPQAVQGLTSRNHNKNVGTSSLNFLSKNKLEKNYKSLNQSLIGGFAKNQEIVSQSLINHQEQLKRSGLKNQLVLKSLESKWESHNEQLKRLDEEQDFELNQGNNTQDKINPLEENDDHEIYANAQLQQDQRKEPSKKESFFDRIEKFNQLDEDQYLERNSNPPHKSQINIPKLDLKFNQSKDNSEYNIIEHQEEQDVMIMFQDKEDDEDILIQDDNSNYEDNLPDLDYQPILITKNSRQLRYQAQKSTLSNLFDAQDAFELEQIERIQYEQVDMGIQTDDDIWLNNFFSNEPQSQVQIQRFNNNQISDHNNNLYDDQEELKINRSRAKTVLQLL